MRLAIISVGVLPLPAVRGGSVERNFIDCIVADNEKAANPIDIVVYSKQDSLALEASRAFKYASFVYINTDSVGYRFSQALRYLLNRFIFKGRIANAFVARIAKVMKNSADSDFVLIENRPEYAIHVRRVSKNAVILNHLHNDFGWKDDWKSKKTILSTDCFLCVSKYIASGLPEGAKKAVLYNGIDTDSINRDRFLAQVEGVRKKYGVGKNDKLILFAGRLSPVKGVKELIEAFCRLNDRNTKLVVVGSSFFGKNERDSYLDELEAAAKPRKKDIVFTGYLGSHDLMPLYASADISAVPSIWEEPAAFAVTESMSFSLPLVTTDSGGIPELCSPECAIIVERGNNFTESLTAAFETLSADASMRKSMGEAGRRRAIELFHANSYRSLIKILESF